MWKLLVAFAVFAAVALYVISKAGDKVDMSGEKHGTEATHAPAPAAAASNPPMGASAAGPAPTASAALPEASAASAAKK